MVRFVRSITRSAAAHSCGVLALLLSGMAALAPIIWSAGAWAAEPQPWQIGMQPSATPVHERLNAFHDELLVITFLIAFFVLGLLLFVIVRFHHTRNPVPTRTQHNTLIEILWTVVPIFILGAILLPSLKLMYYMDRVPNADMTIKVTAHQWYWSYEYPDQAGLAFDSNLIPDKDLKPDQKRLLDVDNPLVVPVGTTIRVLVTGTDVIHSWFVPSFGVQEYAIIGRNNETWMQVEREGTYYGECNQICGVNHAFMPIEVKAVSKADFATWLGEAKKKFAAKAPPGETPTGETPTGETPTGGGAAVATVVAAAATGDGQPARAGDEPAGN